MRLYAVRNIIIFLFLILFVHLFRMQCLKGREYFKQSESNRIRLVPEEASRGIIYDRNDIPLVKNKLAFDVVAVPQELEGKNKSVLFEQLSKFLDVSSQVLADTFNYNYSSRTSFYPVLLSADVPRDVAFLIEQERTKLSGIFIKPRAERQYIYEAATAHLLGYVGMMHKSEYQELKEFGYGINDVIGRSGLEKELEDVLHGQPGGMQLEVNSEGNIIEVLGYKPPVRGQDIHLTIDIGLQNLIYHAMEELKGAVSVMDAQTGEILALYSGPSFNPNVFMDQKQNKQINEILRHKDALMLNRCLQVYPPGSIFKIVTAYAGLKEKKIDPSTTFFCPGHYDLGKAVFRCWLERGHGSVSVEDALATSCNVFFYNVGTRLGAQTLSNYAKEFGLGEPTRVGLPAEQGGVVPNPQWKRTALRQKWYGGDTVNFAIGQGYLLLSPLQALKMVSLVANEGKQVQPHLVKGGKFLSPQVLSPEELRIVRNGMRKVVNTSYGTGIRANVENVPVFAKTGTAQVSGHTAHAWFIGYAQLARENVCFVVFLEHGGHGGGQAADIAKQIVEYLRDKKKI
ncbi:MAG: penicillin-binding protein 2 [Candidatus Omnitrophota bacterium]